MNEAETRTHYILPALQKAGWGVIDGSNIREEFPITKGRLVGSGKRTKPDSADYVLQYKGQNLAVIEAKRGDLNYTEGVGQAKSYAQRLQVQFCYSTNGKQIYEINIDTGTEGDVEVYPSPDELWERTFPTQNSWRDKFFSVPFEDQGGTWQARYYQENAITKALEAIADNKTRILLTLATGTGKTAIAFQIAWKLFQTRWNLNAEGKRQPRILFLADRNILADQAFNAFCAFEEEALIRITPKDIRKKGKVPTNGSVFFTIFQSFMTEDKKGFRFGQYPQDFFDFIIIDECHRGGANDESNWRAIMDYFSPAVQLGLTATPRRDINIDTYHYFGEPVYIYSLKDGINDGFLTPFRVKRIHTTIDDYTYTNDDEIIEGEIEAGKNYKEADFNKIIEIKEREEKRVQLFMDEANENDKTIIFCANQKHAATVRDLVNQYKKSNDTNYCVRVTANDGEIGEQFLREFQDNEKSIPAVLTTSKKLSTGVDVPEVRNIVLLRPVNSMIEFKQIIGRGTRLFDNKDYFTLYDFVGAHQHFQDPDWDGEPVIEEEDSYQPIEPKNTPKVREIGKDDDTAKRQKIKIKLKDGKAREIQHMLATSFWNADGQPISAEEFLNDLLGKLPDFFQDEAELRKMWSYPQTRQTLLKKLAEAGFGQAELNALKKLIDAEKSDLFDVLAYVFNSNIKPISRAERVTRARPKILAFLNEKQTGFIEFVLNQYIKEGVEELSQEKLPTLLKNKYHSFEDAQKVLGNEEDMRALFFEFQHYLYQRSVA